MRSQTLKTLSLRLFEFSAAGEYVSQVVATDVERLHYRLRTPVLGPDGALYITTSGRAASLVYIRFHRKATPEIAL